MPQPAITILITNNTLGKPAGTERYVQTVAKFLLEHGHFPVVYSTQLGQVSDKLRSLGVLVVDNLDNLSVAPDIIHGHHHLDTACAIARFPHTPIIAFNHGVVPWEESSFPSISRIYSYVTVSQACMKRIFTEGIPAEKTEYLPNFVDADEFPIDYSNRAQRTGDRLRALVYGNYPHKGLASIEAACKKHGFQLVKAGGAFGEPVSDPSSLLPNYDLVFATGKGAMEALYCGAEVILSGLHGIGEHITSANFHHLHSRNFGLTAANLPPTPSAVEAAVKSAQKQILSGTRAVSDDYLYSMSHRLILPRLVDLYMQAIAYWHEYQPSPQAQAEEEFIAFSRYLRFLQTSRFRDQEHARYSQLAHAESELARLRNQIDRLKQNPIAYGISAIKRKTFQWLSAFIAQHA